MASTYKANKQLGQHFLVDTGIINSIVQYLHSYHPQHLVEIGPGTGAITNCIATKYDSFDCIEFDNKLATKLKERYATSAQVNIHNNDVLQFNFSKLHKGQDLVVVGNLPYNIGSQIIIHLLQYKKLISNMLFMLQKEVVDTLIAKPGTKKYGRLSIAVQYHCKTQWLFDIPPTAFNPPPAVDSSMVHLQPYYRNNIAINYKHFINLVKSAFAHRRKTIKNNLNKLITSNELTNLGIPPKLRPENLTVDDYINLSNYLFKRNLAASA